MSRAPELNGRYDLVVPKEFKESITGFSGSDPWLQQSNDVMRAIILGSKLARDRAVSWRGFTVGAIGVSLFETLENGDGISRTFFGANDKPDEFGPINIHAEQEVLERAEEHNIQLSVLTVFGSEQPDDGTSVVFPALSPCSKICLPLLQKSPVISRERSIISSVSHDRKKLVLYTLPDLEKAYETNSVNHMTVVEFKHPLPTYELDDRGMDELQEYPDEAKLALGVANFVFNHHQNISLQQKNRSLERIKQTL